tara:strand:- start:1056 stop:2405 length:1350 start_codon:yes stop_codon:yes gene_type:complete
MSKRYLSIASSNGGNGVFGYSAGNPQLKFLVSNNGMLQSQELRFQGTFKRVKNNNPTTPTTNETDKTKDLNVDAFVGIQSVVQNLEISSRQYSNRSLESIQNYPRLVGNFMSSLHSKSGLDTQMFHEQGSKGYGFDTLNEESHLDGTNASTKYSSAGQKIAMRVPYCAIKGIPFDLRLVCGMFMSNDIDLEALGGLAITINLAPNENVLYGGDASDYHYIIENPRLVVPVLSKTEQQQMALAQNPSPQMNFLSFTSLYNTINSTDQQVVHRVSLKGVISSMSNFIPVSYINSYEQNGQAQYNPAIQKLVYNMDGKRFPLEYSIEVDRDETLKETEQPTTNPQLLRNYLEAFRNSKDIKKSCVNPVISGVQSQIEKHGVFGIGCSFDSVSNAGIPAEVSTLGFELQAKLTDPAKFDTAVAQQTTLSYAVYTYYLCRQSVQVANGGIQVVA